MAWNYLCFMLDEWNRYPHQPPGTPTMAMFSARFARVTLLIILFCKVTSWVDADENQTQASLAAHLRPIVDCLGGSQSTFTLNATIDAKIDGKIQRVDAHFARHSDQAFDLDLIHKEYAFQLRRRSDATAMILPKHQVVFVGKGAVDDEDHLAPLHIIQRLVSSSSTLSTYLPIVQSGDAETITAVLNGLLKIRQQPDSNRWSLGPDAVLEILPQEKSFRFASGDTSIRLTLSDAPGTAESIDRFDGMRVVRLDRAELETQLCRGVRRATEIMRPGKGLTSPMQLAKKTEHGELRWIDGERVVLLHGTPEQIGKAHGELLQRESMRCIDSVLYTFGTLETIRRGRWFRHDLSDAYARLAPHIPARHKAETRAIAASLGVDEAVMRSVNIFPELFHCSGFAVFGKATVDGKLYHGRVLDYMTTIGLQDAATTFIIAPEGHHAFATVGYASFTGSVSGMNRVGISLGEMGGGGEGQWDGVPMATLMRRAMEECSTLDDVIKLWSKSPRTCEYYYVFADGKTNEAVAVAATPERIEFVRPGEGHDRLGHGIEDAVVISAGSRLEKLRERVISRHGAIDSEVARWLMSRPVAMQSNLHNVLFVPQDGILYVANASHDKPAAERAYVKIDLAGLLQSMNRSVVRQAAAVDE